MLRRQTEKTISLNVFCLQAHVVLIVLICFVANVSYNQKNVSELSQEHFVSATNVACERKQGNIVGGNFYF